VAIAAAYHVRREGDPFVDISEYVSAYNAVSPLRADERDLLTDLIVSRMAMSTLISTWRAALHPDNSAYILRNVPAAWAGLEAIVPNDRRLEIGS
jgi:Ser/Thr protein kinase RdoA (MazF antagonist)